MSWARSKGVDEGDPPLLGSTDQLAPPRLSGLLWSGIGGLVLKTVLLCQYGNRPVSFGVCGVGGARLPPWPRVFTLDEEKVLANLGDDAASVKVRLMGERCAEPGVGFCTRPAFVMPEERILRSV